VPAEFVVLVLVVPEGVCTMVTVAPATAAPASEFTLPRTEDVVSCAMTTPEEAASSVATAMWTGKRPRIRLYSQSTPMKVTPLFADSAHTFY
jgi:hypothetical protein